MNPELGYQNYVTYGYKRSVRRKKSRWILNFIVLFLLAWIVIVPVYIVKKVASAQEKAQTIVSPLADNPYPQEDTLGVTSTTSASPSTSQLSTIVQNSLSTTKGTYSVAIKHLGTGEEYYYNEHHIYNSASLYKLWTMSVVYSQIADGTLKEDDVVTSDIATLNRIFKIPADSAELQKGQISMSITKALEQMITISHNYSALLLTQKIKASNVSTFLKDNNFSDSKTGTLAKTSAYDITAYYEKLYKGEIINEEYSKKMIDLLSRQRLNDRIPKYLPQGMRVAHKTGELDGVKHDAGIVYSPKGDYIFVVMSDTPRPADAAENTAQLSKAVYEYFISK
jgi:beta-lactamase class A